MQMGIISSKRQIARNTMFLYFRMMFIMVITLYTSRVNLQALGITDNGIYQIVGGVVSMFAFLNNSLSGATSRFLTYEIGRGDKEKLRKTFSSALTAHIALALLILLFAETIGLWFLEKQLVIPAERMNASRVVYQISILSCMLSVTQIPYNAALISHERMNVFAYMSILDAILRLLICYLLFVTPFDKLITYAVLMFLTIASMQVTYRYYCIKNFEECHFSIERDKQILKPILSFSFWDLFGNFGVMMRNEGVNVVLNSFFGPAINAACGFAYNVQGAVRGFSDNFMTAARPPIVKAYSINNLNNMGELMINVSKFSFCLMMLLSTPLFFENDFVMKLWLKTPPPYTGAFCSIALAINLIRVMFSPIIFGIHASGRIRNMSVVNGTILLCIVPISYFLLGSGVTPVIPFIVDFFLMIVLSIADLYFIKQNIPKFDVGKYLKKSTIPCLLIAIPVLLGTMVVRLSIRESCSESIRFMSVCITSTILTFIMTYLIGINRNTRKLIISKIKQKIRN